MNQAERLCRVALEPPNERWHRSQMSIPVPIDKTDTKSAPVQSAIAKLALRGNLARRIRKRRMGCVLLMPGMVRARIIYQSGACHYEASLRSVCLRRRNQVLRSIEVRSPDVIVILSPKNRRKMNDCRNALGRLLQRGRLQQIAFHTCHSNRSFLARSHQRTQSKPASTNRRKSPEPTSPVTPVTKIVMICFLPKCVR
jgi:hypothetical protein